MFSAVSARPSSRFFGKQNRAVRRVRAVSASLALILLSSFAVVAVPTAPAFAALGDQAGLTLSKLVDTESEIVGVEPGETFTYDIVIGCDDNDCIDAALVDALPDEFAGFTLGEIAVSPGNASNFDLELTGGCAVNSALSAGCGIELDFLQPLGALAGVDQFGIVAGTTFRVSYSLTAPLSLEPDWAFNGVAVPNRADLTAVNAAPVTSEARVTVEVPIVVNAAVTKQWTPSSQQYGPGRPSTVTTGVRNTSNVVANALVLQDPSIAVDGATELPTTNPFTRVDFTGLCGVTLPAGADLVQIDAYYEASVGEWNWVAGTPDAIAALPASVTDLSSIGGLRATYTSTTGDTITANGAAGSLCFTVEQRATDRTTAAELVGGGEISNIAAGTVFVTDRDSVTRNAEAELTVTGLSVEVSAGKQITPARVPASGEFSVSLSAKNDSNGTLESLTITEPGVDAFLSDELIFDGFTTSTWPVGAIEADFVWILNTGAQASIPLTNASAAPAIPALGAGEFVAGFTVTYRGEIIAGTTAGWSFTVDTAADMVDSGTVSDRYTNVVGVSGTNAAGTDTATATAPVDVFFPDIDIALNKTLNPERNTPGGTAVVSLETVTSADSQFVRPTEIVVEDVWDGTPASTFWNAYRAQEIVFTDVPAGATLTVEYATGTPPGALAWQELTVPGGVTSLIESLAVPANAVGIRFTYENSAGFGQGTTVSPNIVFEAAATLRDGVTPTSVAGESATRYFNEASAQGFGMADSLPVASDVVTDSDQIDVIVFDDAAGPGTLLSSKRWTGTNWSSDLNRLNTQSGAAARTVLGWGVTTPGYEAVVVSDAAAGSETAPATTVYQAFDLTRVSPISFQVDPLLRWDVVTNVELFRAGTWQAVTPPAGGWMDSTGFRGHVLTTAESAQSTGVRITVEENTAARTASTSPTRPAPGSGVASSANERQLRLEWALRNTLRVPLSPELKWTTQDVAYNLAGEGVVRNTFGLQATASGTTTSRTAFDDIALIDTTPNVDTRKTASESFVTVPYFGDVALEDYPTVDFTVDAWNTASARASYLRSADPFPCPLVGPCVTPATDHSANVYAGATYDPLTNPFERFTLTDLSFATPTGTNIDPTVSQVALWKRDSSGVLSVEQTTIAAAAALTATQLEDVVGVSVVYQSTDPETTGGLIPQQNSTAAHPSMTLSTQLRATLRSTPVALVTSGITVVNSSQAQSFDPVLTPDGAASTPNASSQASVELREARLDVSASKSIAPGTILEANPGAPVTVKLGSTSGSSTLGAQTATIRDIDSEFWNAFQLSALGSATLPTGATQVRVDVQVNEDPAWILGTPSATPALPATVTDLSEITGIQFVFDRADGEPFSNTVPSADWSAEANFTAVLRDSVTFPGAVDNAITAFAEHDDYPVQDAAASDDVVLSAGTAQIDVRKEAVTGNSTNIVEPGVDIPWTLEFTNTGTGYLDVTSVSDSFDAMLQWDGSAPTYETSAGGTLPATGIEVTQPTAGELEFNWPGAAQMQPGEKFVITLKFSLLPGLTALETATNEFTVSTTQTLTACTNVSGNRQGTLAGLSDTECGTSNFVQPLAGALLFAQKSVQGEVDGSLVSGAINIQDPGLPCSADSEGFFRSKCVARTAVGATDTWRLVATNSGTVGYTAVTVVDVLPSAGDKLLATGAARGSDFRPVLKEAAAPGTESVPTGATTVWEVSTDAQACIGSSAGSDWGTNPMCSTTTWVSGASYTGAREDITAVRWTVDFSGSAGGILAPGGTVELRFDTVNVPLVSSDAISVAVPVGDQIAWNQFGVVATPTSGALIRRAPVQTGVVAQAAALEVAKAVEGDAASFAPATFDVTLACTVPDGEGSVAAVDMGSFRTVSVPANDSIAVDGIPLGATCIVDSETADGGATRTDLGASATLTSTEVAGEITVTNTFEGGPLDIIKKRVGIAALSHGAGPFTVQVVCEWEPNGILTPITLPGDGTLILDADNNYRAQLPIMPVGTTCIVEETDAGNATATTMDPADGSIAIVQPGLFVAAASVTITNVFDSSLLPPLLAFTGQQSTMILLLVGLAILLIGGALVLVRRRRA